MTSPLHIGGWKKSMIDTLRCELVYALCNTIDSHVYHCIRMYVYYIKHCSNNIM